ncbi:MAG: glutaminyl-peptide cyclotransferase, partial [Telluria sp.]
MKKINHAAFIRFVLGALALPVLGLGSAQAAIPVYTFMVKHAYPHDTQAFTQGLFIKDGALFESTGMKGQSSIRRVQLETGRVLQKLDLAPEFFGEGIAPVGNDIVSLTWQSKVGFVHDAKTLKLKRKFSYEGEGWGLASNGTQVFMSDGTPSIRLLDPKTLNETKRIQVSAGGKPVPNLNE